LADDHKAGSDDEGCFRVRFEAADDDHEASESWEGRDALEFGINCPLTTVMNGTLEPRSYAWTGICSQGTLVDSRNEGSCPGRWSRSARNSSEAVVFADVESRVVFRISASGNLVLHLWGALRLFYPRLLKGKDMEDGGGLSRKEEKEGIDTGTIS
jgi:hypothetical protein